MKMRVTDPLRSAQINTALGANERGMEITSTPAVVMTVAGVFSVLHDLGEVPDDFRFSRVDNVAYLYANGNSRAMWTDTSCQLAASSAGQVIVWFVKRV